MRTLLVLKGLPGIGKSTLARALGRDLRWPILDKDDFLLVTAGRTDQPDRVAYDLLFHLVGRLLGQGLDVLCDSPLQYPSLYAHAQKMADEADARLLVLECTLDEAEHRRRVEGRLGLPAHAVTSWSTLQAYVERARPHADYRIDAPRLSVDLGRPREILVSETAAWLARNAPHPG